MEQPPTPEPSTLTPKALAARMGISPRKLRQILRAEYPRDVIKRKWEIPETLAKKIERDYKAMVKAKEAKKQAEIQNQLKGKE